MTGGVTPVAARGWPWQKAPVSGPEVSAAIGLLVTQVAASMGVRLEVDLPAGPDARIPLALEQALWDEAARRTGDAAFGLHAAELLRPGAFEVLDYAVRTAPTVRAAVQRLVRYNRIVHDTAEFTLHEQGGLARIEHALRGGGVTQSRHGAEFTLAAVLVLGRQISGSNLRARAVAFHHGRAPDAVIAEHVRLFGVEPRFADRVNALELDSATLDLGCPASDPALSRVIERHAEALLAAMPPLATGVADRVRALLAGALGVGDATLSRVAAKLKMSERTLQRKLAEESVSFDALVDDFRRELALRYLADPKIAVAEVAYLLGYSEPSPFHRAFKRWTGITPTEARRRAA